MARGEILTNHPAWVVATPIPDVFHRIGCGNPIGMIDKDRFYAFACSKLLEQLHRN